MKTATEVFKEHYKKRTGKDCDSAILHDMDYCIRAMHEYAQQYINLSNSVCVKCTWVELPDKTSICSSCGSKCPF